jgi:uncharacterized membrane protein YgaE (UPF0421/DUF939 family)
VAQLCRLPGMYWAPITTLVITQSSLGAAWAVYWQPFVGTALGAVLGGAMATCPGPHAVLFGAGVFLMGLLCAAVHSGWSAYRFGGVTLAIVVLIPSTDPAWLAALHRFAEVSIGIGVALLFALVWPEEETPKGEAKGTHI